MINSNNYRIIGLEEVADQISDQLKCPITIEDANHRILTYSSHIEETDPARIATIIGKRVPEKVINALWKAGIIPLLQKSDDPIRVAKITEVGLGNRVAIAIRHQEEVIGYIWAIDNDNHLNDKAFGQLKDLSKVVKNKLLSSKANVEKTNNQEIFKNILGGYISSENKILEMFKKMQINPPATFLIMVLRFPAYIDTKLEKQILYLINTTQKVKIVLYLIDNHEVVLLVSCEKIGNDYLEYLINFQEKMGERYKIRNIIVGIGLKYTNPKEIIKSYRQALTVVDIKQKFPQETQKKFSYESLGIFRYFEIIQKRNKEDGLENYALVSLKNYDIKNNSQLIKTFEVFFENNFDYNKTAKKLHIHINTLKYRLKRICEIGLIELTDYNQIISLYIDLKLEKL